jgi:hypothetical protein
MQVHGSFAAGFAAFLFVSAPVLAQSSPASQQQSADKMTAANGADTPTGAEKQHTAGTAGFQEPQYGGAQKQHTAGTAGAEPQQYGTTWSRTRNQPDNQ